MQFLKQDLEMIQVLEWSKEEAIKGICREIPMYTQIPIYRPPPKLIEIPLQEVPRKLLDLDININTHFERKFPLSRGCDLQKCIKDLISHTSKSHKNSIV